MRKRIRRVLSSIRCFVMLTRQNISLGRNVSLDYGIRFKATDGGVIKIGNGVSFKRFADLHAKFGCLSVGDGTYIGPWSIITSREEIKIGANCLIAEYVVIRDQNHDFAEGRLTNKAGFSCAPIYIGSNVWIGAKATILQGVTIGDNSVVGANAVVTQDVPSGVVVGGVPARVLKKIE